MSSKTTTFPRDFVVNERTEEHRKRCACLATELWNRRRSLGFFFSMNDFTGLKRFKETK